MIISNRNYVGGKPRIKGHRIWVSHIIVHVKEMGLEKYIEDFNLGESDSKIRNKIREAIEYCMNEKCDEDYQNEELVSYCQDCSKSKKFSGPNLWEVAKRLYEKLK